MKELSTYYDEATIADQVKKGHHRGIVGGLWDELGSLQLAFLKKSGLTPQSTLLDIGCGSLRLGVQAVQYLDPNRYWGTDLNGSLLAAGYDKEITAAGLSAKLPRHHLVQDSDFRFEGIPHEIDFAIATSVFTHLPLNHIRLCLASLAKHVTGQCTFCFTVFTPPAGGDVTQPHLQAPNVRTFPHRDPYHYSVADIYYAAAGLPWTVEFVGNWNHPRNQKMVRASLRREV